MTPSATATDAAVADRPAVTTEQAADVAPAGARKVAPYVVDCDCHHVWRQIEDIFAPGVSRAKGTQPVAAVSVVEGDQGPDAGGGGQPGGGEG